MKHRKSLTSAYILRVNLSFATQLQNKNLKTGERKSRPQHLNIVVKRIYKMPNARDFIYIVFKIDCFT
jgi:hypothetical protein